MRSTLLPVTIALFLSGLSFAAPGANSPKLFSSDSVLGGRFGSTLDSDGERLIVGRPNGIGAAYVFERGASGWEETALLASAAPIGFEEFGTSVVIEGQRAAIGALRFNGPYDDTGAVYVFEEGAAGWTETTRIVPSIGGGDPVFVGASVDLSGNRLAIGSMGSGAWVYEYAGGTWTEIGVFPPPATSIFGSAVAIEGDFLVVGSREDFSSGDLSGRVYVYERQGSSWVHVQTIAPPVSSILAQFGGSLALEGDLLVAGASSTMIGGQHVGAAFVFERVNGLFVPVETLLPATLDEHASFGWSVDLVGDRILVGAPGAIGPGGNSGGAFLFERSGSDWLQAARLDSIHGEGSFSVGAQGDAAGMAVAFAGETLFVGSPGDDEAAINAGSVLVFDLAPTVETFCHCASAAPCGNEDEWGGCENVAGQGAVLAAWGRAGVASDELFLQATFLPDSAPGLLFMGSNTRPPLPFGNGQLCVGGGGPLFRFPVRFADDRGNAQEGPGIALHASAHFGAAGQILAGSTWHFQHWYRDPAGPCSAPFSTSNGVSVTFGP